MAKCPYCNTPCGNDHCAYKEDDVKSFDERIKDAIDNAPPLDEPFRVYFIFGLMLMLYKKLALELDLCETESYAPDGDTPLLFVRLGWVEFVFENKTLYKLIYKRRHGYAPWGLEKK